MPQRQTASHRQPGRHPDDASLFFAGSPADAIIREHGLTDAFPAAALEAAGCFGLDPDPDDIEREIAAGRLDLRDRRTITIDSEDARDLDDAVDIAALPDGGYQLGVHIADVAHYVVENSALDREAMRRGTSVYLVDHVLPMLPPQLSNGICSLNPASSRLTLSVLLTFSPAGEVRSGRAVEAVIRSRARVSYNEVRIALEGDDVPPGWPDGLLGDLHVMRQLADILAQRRRVRGALDFELAESHVVLNQQGWPALIEPAPANFATAIIESFMIAANEFIAAQGLARKLPLLFRVHELPDSEKLNRFLSQAALFGLPTRPHGRLQPAHLADLLEKARLLPQGAALAELLLRAMAKARYAAENSGHFGLASDCYCHFTSPIRRYPDLFTHRVIKAALHGSTIKKRWRESAPAVAEHCSDTERIAMQAERDSIRQMMALHMSRHLGETYPGLVSGFGPAGIYVQLASSVEGLVPFRSLAGYYVFDESRLEAAERSSGRAFRLGDEVTVLVARSDPATRQIDFELVEPAGRPALARLPAVRRKNRENEKKGRPSGKAATGRPDHKRKKKNGQRRFR